MRFVQQQWPVDSGGRERCSRTQLDGVRAPESQETKKKKHRQRPRRCGRGKASRGQRTGGSGTLEASTKRSRSRSGERTSWMLAWLEEKSRGQGASITKIK